jgi:hypothetical protein
MDVTKTQFKRSLIHLAKSLGVKPLAIDNLLSACLIDFMKQLVLLSFRLNRQPYFEQDDTTFRAFCRIKDALNELHDFGEIKYKKD